MTVKQLSIFMENKNGRLADVTACLAAAQVDIRGLFVADTTEYGILRLIVSDPEAAAQLLKKNGFTVFLSDVVCLTIPNTPGGLCQTVDRLAHAGVNVDYMYASLHPENATASVILSTPDNAAAKAILAKE